MKISSKFEIFFDRESNTSSNSRFIDCKILEFNWTKIEKENKINLI